MSEVTNEGARLIALFLNCNKHVETAERELRGAKCDAVRAESELAKWLAPKDMEPGEKVGVWMGDSLFQVENVEVRNYPEGGGLPDMLYELKVTVRSRGKHFQDLYRAA